MVRWVEIVKRAMMGSDQALLTYVAIPDVPNPSAACLNLRTRWGHLGNDPTTRNLRGLLRYADKWPDRTDK